MNLNDVREKNLAELKILINTFSAEVSKERLLKLSKLPTSVGSLMFSPLYIDGKLISDRERAYLFAYGRVANTSKVSRPGTTRNRTNL